MRNLAPFQRIELEERRAEFLKRKAASNLQLSPGRPEKGFQISEKVSGRPCEPVNVVKTVAQRSGVSTDTVAAQAPPVSIAARLDPMKPNERYCCLMPARH